MTTNELKARMLQTKRQNSSVVMPSFDECDDYEYEEGSDDGYCDRVEETIAELNQCLPMGHRITDSKLQSVAGQIVDKKMSFDAALASLTSKKPVLLKR